MARPTARWASRLYLPGLVVTTLIGVTLRAIYLDIPMRYDESVTYLSYASRGWAYLTTHYQVPNNHVFHSLLVSWLTSWLGDAPVVIRLPAFLAGCALVPATGWVGRRLSGPWVGVLAAGVVATLPVLVEFSTNARGYTILSLCIVLAIGTGSVLAEGGRRIAWLAWIEAGVIAAFTIPSAAIPWLGLTIWLGVRLHEGRSDAVGTSSALAPLARASVVIALVVLALYSGIIRSEGLGVLTGNRFVAPQRLDVFLGGLPSAAAATLGHWARGVPVVPALLVAASAVAGTALASRPWKQLLASLALGSAVAVAVARNVGEPRIWLWAAPVVAVTAATGVVEAARRWSRAGAAVPAAVTTAWVVAMSAYIVLAGPVRASTETGVLPRAGEVLDSIARDYRRGDGIVSDFVSVEPLRYYLHRWAETHEAPGRSAIRRSWVVLFTGDSARSARLRSRVARLGMPPLEQSTPVFDFGDVRVYLFGRPAGAVDPRLAEAVEWHTGVAGHVDEDRAHTLVSEVANDTGSPLALAWIERCRKLGCMGFRDDGSVGRVGRETFAELNELALAGGAEAAFLLGSSLHEGWGGTLDPSAGAEWYRRAAEAGHVLAARKLGDAYSAGTGVARSDSAAVSWWSRAAEAGDAVAEAELGTAYETGRGVERDPARARRWLEQSLERGNDLARDALERVGPG